MPDVHTSHCCVLHSCKYGDPDCTVTTRREKQESICEHCEMDGITTIPDPDDPDFDLLMMSEFGLRNEAKRLRDLLRQNNLGIGEPFEPVQGEVE